MWKVPDDRRDTWRIEVDGVLLDLHRNRRKIVQAHNSEVRKLKREIRELQKKLESTHG